MYFSLKRKIRGQKRKLNLLLKNIDSIEPFQNTESAYEHFHVPSSMFISHPKTYSKIKTEFCRAWLRKTEEFILNKPESLPFCKVVAVICEPDFWESQIVIFYSEEYFKDFFERNHDSLSSLDSSNRSFSKRRNIKTSLSEKGVKELCEESVLPGHNEAELWFYEENDIT